MPELIAPAAHLYAPWLEAHAEWGEGLHEDGFGLLETDDVESPAGFDTWLARLTTEAGRCTYRWIVDGNRVLGGIALRHDTHESVRRAGHIGFGIRPSARGCGLAAWALGQMLAEARGLSMDRVFVFCAAGNTASAKTIESQGGRLDGTADTTGAARRYRIGLAGG